MNIVPDREEIMTSTRAYKYVLSRGDIKIKQCSVCGEPVITPHRQIQYHKSEESGHWINDFTIFGHRNCLINARRRER